MTTTGWVRTAALPISRSLIGLAYAVCAGITACSANADTDDAPSGATVAGAGAGGRASNQGGMVTGAVSGAASAGHGGRDGTGGGGGSAGTGDGAIAATDVSCARGQISFRGTLEGTPLDESFRLAGLDGADPNKPGDRKDVSIRTGGTLILETAMGFVDVYRGGGGLPILQLGRAYGVSGLLQLPAESARAGELYCHDESTLTKVAHPELADVGVFALRGLRSLGTCPGEPVSGAIEVCADCLSLTGAIEGVQLDGRAWYFRNGEDSWVEVTDSVRLRVTRGGEPAQGILRSGLIMMPPTGPLADHVYCVDEGTYEDDTAQGKGLIRIRSMSRLGTCAGATSSDGELTGCLKY